MNATRVLGLSALGFFIGTLFFYYGVKRVHEDKWAWSYGQDLPYHMHWDFQRVMHYYRAYLIHFYRYKVFYFLEEQAIDPLNDNILSPKSFDVYQFKRLIRAMNYDKRRDSSFDFLNIAEDDIDEFDDFV